MASYAELEYLGHVSCIQMIPCLPAGGPKKQTAENIVLQMHSKKKNYRLKYSDFLYIAAHGNTFVE